MVTLTEVSTTCDLDSDDVSHANVTTNSLSQDDAHLGNHALPTFNTV